MIEFFPKIKKVKYEGPDRWCANSGIISDWIIEETGIAVEIYSDSFWP